jgi:hypothetical protein
VSKGKALVAITEADSDESLAEGAAVAWAAPSGTLVQFVGEGPREVLLHQRVESLDARIEGHLGQGGGVGVPADPQVGDGRGGMVLDDGVICRARETLLDAIDRAPGNLVDPISVQ